MVELVRRGLALDFLVSEANTDVPGGYIEASGFTRLIAENYPRLARPPDPAEALVRAIAKCAGTGAFVALVHATAYTDDHLGRVGEGIGLRGVTPPPEWETIRRQALRRPGDWVAQRRFQVRPLCCGAGRVYPVLGVFTIDGQAAGIYARLAPQPLIDARAQDVAVLLEPSAG